MFGKVSPRWGDFFLSSGLREKIEPAECLGPWVRALERRKLDYDRFSALAQADPAAARKELSEARRDAVHLAEARADLLLGSKDSRTGKRPEIIDSLGPDSLERKAWRIEGLLVYHYKYLPQGTITELVEFRQKAFDRLKALEAARVQDVVRAEYQGFLKRLGFKEYAAQAAQELESPSLTPLQREVLAYNRERLRAFDDSRELAAEVMAALSLRPDREQALEDAAELAARLLSLQPLEPPSTLPPETAKKGEEVIVDWFSAVTRQRLAVQLAQVLSDLAYTISTPEQRQEPAPAVLERVAALKAPVERLLTLMYADAEWGQTRYAGRALAASLVRLARAGRPELEESLRRRLAERDLELDNFVGDRLIVPDRKAASGVARLRLETGDILGERSAGREAAEITFAVRPAWRLWPKALKEGILGHLLSLPANPASPPTLTPGRGLINRVKLAFFSFQGWLAARPALRRGYSHVGIASVEEADGVKMAWAYDNYPNAGEGGIRKIGIIEQFSLSGPFLRLGVARWDARRVWDAFQAQSKEGYRETAYDAKAISWPARISPEAHRVLRDIPRAKADELSRAIHAGAMESLEAMMATMGVGFAHGFDETPGRAYCSSTLMLAYRMGALFEFQALQDRWHTLIRGMKALGIGKAASQNMDSRIIWPGSLFIDPKVSRHTRVDFPKFTEVGRLPDPFTMGSYVERDPALSRRLVARMGVGGQGGLAPDEETVDRALRLHLDARRQKGSAKGLASGSRARGGYSDGLFELLGSEE